jgi:hypothetical protein
VRAGDNRYPDHNRKNKVTAGLDRASEAEYLSYSEKAPGGRGTKGKRFDSPGTIGLTRAGNNAVFNLPRPARANVALLNVRGLNDSVTEVTVN